MIKDWHKIIDIRALRLQIDNDWHHEIRTLFLSSKKMFSFRHYALAVQEFNPDPSSTSELKLSVGDLLLVLKEYETGLGWTLVQKLDLKKVHSAGCRLYDNGIEQKHVGFVPSGRFCELL